MAESSEIITGGRWQDDVRGWLLVPCICGALTRQVPDYEQYKRHQLEGRGVPGLPP